MKLQCAVIDDEPLARECIEGYISQVDFLELAGVGSNPVELGRLMLRHPVDLIFLDVQMPLMSGIDFLKLMPERPMVILTTAYPHYALESFQLDVMDYLVKPITFERFVKAAAKARDYYQLASPAQVQPAAQADYFFIKSDYRYEKIFFDDILFVEALQNYVTIQTRTRKFMTLLYLKNLEDRLDPKRFIRVHKSYIVAIPHIDTIEQHQVRIGAYHVPVSRLYKDELIGKVVSDKLWKK
jgi:DNA-binding LytR/AlgR family response regulator